MDDDHESSVGLLVNQLRWTKMILIGSYSNFFRELIMSKLKKLPGHVAKETDVALCKQFREYPKQKSAILVLLFQCPLRHRCGFWQESATWRAPTGCSSIGAASTMQTVTVSHDEDKSKYLKYDA
jgi:hypothetical protein